MFQLPFGASMSLNKILLALNYNYQEQFLFLIMNTSPRISWTYQSRPHSLSQRPLSHTNHQPYQNRATRTMTQNHQNIKPQIQNQQKSHIRLLDDANQIETKQKKTRKSIFNSNIANNKSTSPIIAQVSQRDRISQLISTRKNGLHIFTNNNQFEYANRTPPNNIKKQPMISNFLVPEIKHSLESPLELSQKKTPNEYLDRLLEKEKELSYLKMELERYKRCENLINENQGIYKKLVKNLYKTSEELQHKIQKNDTSPQRQRSNQFKRSPSRTNKQSISPEKSMKIEQENHLLMKQLNLQLNRQVSFGKTKNTQTHPEQINNKDYTYTKRQDQVQQKESETNRLKSMKTTTIKPTQYLQIKQGQLRSELSNLNDKIQLRIEMRNRSKSHYQNTKTGKISSKPIGNYKMNNDYRYSISHFQSNRTYQGQ